jgi:carbonic anhydrase
VKLGNLTNLISKIKPAIDAEVTFTKNRNSKNTAFVERVAELNVHHVLKQVINQSAILADMLDKGEIALVGGMYNVETGVVEFYENEVVASGVVEQEAATV